MTTEQALQAQDHAATTTGCPCRHKHETLCPCVVTDELEITDEETADIEKKYRQAAGRLEEQ